MVWPYGNLPQGQEIDLSEFGHFLEEA